MTIPIMYQGRQQEPQPQLYSYGQQQMQYGGMSADVVKTPNVNWRRRRLNMVAICICLFVPWLLFCFMFWLTSFKLFYRQPAMCYLIALLMLGFVGYLGSKTWDAVKGGQDGDTPCEPSWYIFLFLTSLFAWALGIYVGYHNFYYRMEPYFGIQNLGDYSGVDPGKMDGEQIMDGGRVVFKPGTHIDLAKSMSFRNNDLYCVAPIVSANASVAGPGESYDFWAVGVNCCCGDTVRAANFQCGEFMNSNAAAGLRLMSDEQRPFYRLAVQQAVGAYGIRAKHPLFFHWVQDPVSASESYRWEGHRQYLIGVYLHFAFQLLLVCLATWAFAKGGS